MATVSKWTPFGVALDITATGSTVTRKSATQYTIKINASWETYYSGAQTNYGMTASSGGGSVNLNTFGKKSSSGSGSFTGTYSISGNGSATKTITVTFKNYEEDWQGNVTESATKTVSFNVTVPAWTSYTVKYNANGGSGAPSNQTKWKDQTLKLSTTKPTRTGYTFQGWATSASGSVAYASGANYTANASVTLYAVWKAITYTVKYNANGGSGAPSSQTKTYGKALTLSSTIPTRTSIEDNGTITEYVFKGWATSATSTSVAYKAGASYTANAAVTLYAVWSRNISVSLYDVSYNTNGGSEVIPQIKVKGETLTLRSTIPVKNGYSFAGWSLSADSTEVSYNSGDEYTLDESIILYAVWTPWTHTVKFDANGGTGNISTNGESVIETYIGNIAPDDIYGYYHTYEVTSDGYFKLSNSSSSGSYCYIEGQTTNAKSIYKVVEDYSTAIASDYNYYLLTVSDIPGDFTATTGVNTITPYCSLKKENCTFKCWSTSPTGSGGTNYYIGDGYTGVQDGGVVTLYAIWNERKISIYRSRKCEATEFIESDDEICFKNNGAVYARHFVETDWKVIENRISEPDDIMEAPYYNKYKINDNGHFELYNDDSILGTSSGYSYIGDDATDAEAIYKVVHSYDGETYNYTYFLLTIYSDIRFDYSGFVFGELIER